MRSRVGLLFAFALSIGCGDGGSAPGAPLPMPGTGGGTGMFSGTDRGGGSDRTNGTDRGGGSAPAIGGSSGGESETLSSTPTTCTASQDCGTGAYCNKRSSASVGYCLTLCSLGAQETVSVSAQCPAGYSCVRPSPGSSPICLLPCESAGGCPSLAGLSTVCARAVSAIQQNFCVWLPPQQG